MKYSLRHLEKTIQLKKICNHNDEMWSIDLAVFSDYKISNNKRYRYIFNEIDNFSKFVWALPLKNKNSKTVTYDFSNVLSTSKRSPLRIESDRGTEFHNAVFQNLLKGWIIHHFSRFSDKRTAIAERMIRTIRSLLKKPVFEKGNAEWFSELPSVIEQINFTIHHSIKMTPGQASKKSKEIEVYSNL